MQFRLDDHAAARSARIASRPAGTATLLLICADIFGIFTSVSMVGPLLVDLSRDLGVSLGQAGLLATAMAIPWALASPFAGLVSDRVGRRPMIVTALGGIGAMFLLASTVASFGALLAVRFVAGVLGSCGPTSLMASVGDLFPAERRSRAMGWFSVGFSLAALTGVPAIGALGGWLGWRWAFATMGGVMLGLALVTRLAFPASGATALDASVLGTYRAVLGVPRLVSVLGANLAERSMFAMATFYLPAFLMLRYGLSAVDVAPLLSVIAVGAIAGNVAGGWLGDRLSRAGVFVVVQASAGLLGAVLFGLPLPAVAAVGLAAAFGLANSASRPAFLALASELAPAHRGATFGLLGLTNQGGLVVGSALGGLMLETGGYGAFAIAVLLQGAVAAGLALPLTRPAPGPSA